MVEFGNLSPLESLGIKPMDLGPGPKQKMVQILLFSKFVFGSISSSTIQKAIAKMLWHYYRHCICYPCSFSFQLFALFTHWRFMTWADMLDELQEHVESIDMANGNVYIVSYMCVCMHDCMCMLVSYIYLGVREHCL